MMDRSARRLGLDLAMTRRDFINGALAGSMALASTAPRAAPATGLLGPSWTGPGGRGDYRFSNGNTHEVVNAAHAVRDGRFDARPVDAELDPLEYDLAIVGGGIAGLAAAWEFYKASGGSRRCLVLDNHRMFGGEAKGNLFEVDGYQIAAPQGSNAFTTASTGPIHALWEELKIPGEYRFAEAVNTDGPLRIAKDHFGPMLYTDVRTSIGYWFREAGSRRGSWHKDIWNDDLRTVPWPEPLKQDFLRWRQTEELKLAPGITPLPPASDLYAWRKASESAGLGPYLDSMSYADYLQKVLGLDPAVARYIDPLVGVGLSGTASDAVSAYAAQRVLFPGVTPRSMTALYEKFDPVTSPIGNGLLARYFVKALLPDAIPGDTSIQQVLRHPVDLAALDRPGAPTRIRLAATAVRVEHEGSSDSASHVRITYSRDGKVQAVRARQVIMAGGGWMNRHVVRDLPQEIGEAYSTFHNGPVLTVNVALRHWRFLDRLGISGVRWFEGIGFFANIIRPMQLGGAQDAPLDPGKPVALTFYIPFLHPGLPGPAQCSAGRAELFAGTFADFELKVRRQLQDMFARHGFDARRDIAGMILNRWGHAYVCAQPGFFFGRDGRPAPRDVVRKGYGRIGFAHSELQGNQNWYAAYSEAQRAVKHVTDGLATAGG